MKNCHIIIIIIIIISNNKTNNYNKCLCKQYVNRYKTGESFRSWLANLGRKRLRNVAIPLTRDNLPGLVSNLTSIN